MAATTKTIFEWLLERIGLVIFVLVFVVQIVRGFFRTRRAQPVPNAKPDELEAERRTRELQEQIRRRRAEREGGLRPADAPPVQREVPPPMLPRRVETTQLPDTFGGPLRRMLEDAQRRTELAPPSMPAAEVRNAEVARQEQIAEQLRVLEESRMLAKRRATQVTAANLSEAQSEGGLRATARGKLLEDVRDPGSLRRAFVLREVLGPPVALR